MYWYKYLTLLSSAYLRGDAEIVVLGELVAAQHLRPRVAVLLHPHLAARLDGETQRAARPDRRVQAHGREERAEEESGVGVAPYPQQRHPRLGLLCHLADRVVVQEIWEPHLAVSYALTQ